MLISLKGRHNSNGGTRLRSGLVDESAQTFGSMKPRICLKERELSA